MVFDLSHEANAQSVLALDAITERLPVRRLSLAGVARLQESMHRFGFLDNFPLIVLALRGGTYQLLDGNHRYEAARALGLESVPCVIKTNLTEQERYTLALRSNSAAETVVPSTLVTYTEFIQARSERYTQMQLAEMLGWSREKVKDYGRLSQISSEAWNVIGETFEASRHKWQEGPSPQNGEISPFTEWLLRSLLGLPSAQQLELVTELASARITKGQFKSRAESYRVRNEMSIYARQQLGDLGEEWSARASEEISSGHYDADWKTGEHPKLQKLLTVLREEWERKQSIHLIHGSFYEEAHQLGNGCIDLLLTDPPYNIARKNAFILQGRAPRSQDFGPWDSYDRQEFLALFDIWAREWERLLRPQGSGYVFTSDRSISSLGDALENAGLHVKATIVWTKTNPPPAVVQTNFVSSAEYMLFFTKGQGGHTFHWQGDEDMHNVLKAPICAGHERLVDSKGKTLHPTQKPEQILQHVMEISSNRGDMVLDCFAGVGSTGMVAKRLGRKFIGIEQDKAYFDAMQRRLAE